MTRTMTCIVCPKGCTLEVKGIPDAGSAGAAGSIDVEGAGCRQGVEYALREIADPRRVLTSTVRTSSAARRRLAVRTSGPIPLPRLAEAARALDGVLVAPPLLCGTAIERDWLGLGVDLVAADDLE